MLRSAGERPWAVLPGITGFLTIPGNPNNNLPFHLSFLELVSAPVDKESWSGGSRTQVSSGALRALPGPVLYTQPAASLFPEASGC